MDPPSSRTAASMFPMRGSFDPGAGIPLFPRFKELGLEDRFVVESFTRRHSPYSDFNFTSLWSWDTAQAIRISRLNGNLVVRFTDYTTGAPFYSFLGDSAPEDTAKRLATHARMEGISPELKLLSQSAAQKLAQAGFDVQEDWDNHDYVLSVERMASYQGNKLGPRRNFVNRFNRSYQAHTVPINLCDPGVQRQTLEVFRRWAEEKGAAAGNVENELVAFRRLLFAADTIPRLFAVGTFIGDEMVGFCVTEILDKGYCVLHFEKALAATYVGIYAYMMQQTAQLLGGLGCQFINYEQDLGVPGLRHKKQSLSPAGLLRKYTAKTQRDSAAYAVWEPRESIAPCYRNSDVWVG